MWARISPGLSLESMSLGPEDEGQTPKRAQGLSEGGMVSEEGEVSDGGGIRETPQVDRPSRGSDCAGKGHCGGRLKSPLK